VTRSRWLESGVGEGADAADGICLTQSLFGPDFYEHSDPRAQTRRERPQRTVRASLLTPGEIVSGQWAVGNMRMVGEQLSHTTSWPTNLSPLINAEALVWEHTHNEVFVDEVGTQLPFLAD